MELWYPKGVDVIPNNYKGNLLNYWEKIVLHTTESYVYHPSSVNYYGHQLWPTATLARFLPGTNALSEWRIFNHLPLNRSAAAMRNLQGGVQTNNDGCVQIEIAWKAAEGQNLPTEALDVLQGWMLWVCAETGIPYSFVDDFHYYVPEDGHRLGQEPWRLRGKDWDDFRGIVGHQHADENVHGDPGKINVIYLKDLGIAVPKEETEEMDRYFYIASVGNARYLLRDQLIEPTLIPTVEDLNQLFNNLPKVINLGSVSQEFIDGLPKL